MAVKSLSDYKSLFGIAKQRGVKIEAVVIHPESLAPLISAISAMGERPFPYCRRTWRRLWHKPDLRPFLYGVPVALNYGIPAGTVGCATIGPMPPDLAEMFSGDFNLIPQEQKGPAPQPVTEPGAMQMLSQSVDTEKASLSDLMIKAMEGLDGASGIVVLRFWGDRFDVITNFNQLECQAVLQKAAMRLMAEGMNG